MANQKIFLYSPSPFIQGSAVAGAALWAAVATALAAKSGVPLMWEAAQPALDSLTAAAHPALNSLTAAAISSSSSVSAASSLDRTVLGGLIGGIPGDSPGQWLQLILAAAVSPAGGESGGGWGGPGSVVVAAHPGCSSELCRWGVCAEGGVPLQVRWERWGA